MVFTDEISKVRGFFWVFIFIRGLTKRAQIPFSA